MKQLDLNKFFAGLIVFLFSYYISFATVTITTSGTSGTSISADKAFGSIAPAYTTLTNIALTSGTSTDFSIGVSSFVLSIPANWQFQAATGSVLGAGNITGATIVVNSTTVTVSYSCTGPSTSNAIIISGLQVQGTVLTTIPPAPITRTSGTGGTISGFTTGASVGSLAQVAGNFVKLQILLPGETAAPGNAAGKTGTPSSQTAGVNFNVIVNAVDANWNLSTVTTDNVGLSASDANATVPASGALASGTKTYFGVQFKTAVSQTVTATDLTNSSKNANTSPSVTTITGAFTKLLMIMPGETAVAGTTFGKTGTPTAPLVAGTAYSVTVLAVDANWNKVSSITDVVQIGSSDVNAGLPPASALISGSNTYSVTLKTAGSRTTSATDITDGTKTASTSSFVTVISGLFSKLQLLLPGESAAAGTATGKTGTPSSPTAAIAFTVTVNSVDANWNIVSNTDMIAISSSDAFATLPASSALTTGVKTFSVKLNTLGSQTVTATDVSDGSKAAGTSPAVTVTNGAFTKMQLLLPGEVAAPGTTTGKTGTPTTLVAGNSFSVTVNAVDANWYVVSSATDVVGITSTDVNAALPANNALSSGTQNFTVILKTAGSKTITASDITAPARTANTSPSVTVASGAFVKLLLLMPGETATAGSATGKIGTPSARAAGTAFSVIVNAVDANWNKVTTVTNTVSITTNDTKATAPTNAALVAGTKTLSITLKTPTSSATVSASNVTDPSKTVSTSPATVVNIGGFTKLQLLVPGETAAPGTTSGKTGTPNTQIAGSSFIVTVNAVDAAWNIVTTVNDVVKITSTDVNGALPANTALSSGTKLLTLILKTAGAKTLTVSDVTTPARTANSSPSITISAGAIVKLQLLLPGETAAPGTATGKAGTPSARATGTAFNVTVNAVDANWNKVTTITHTVNISSTDAAGVMPANAALASGTKTNFSVTLKTPGTQTVTATDVTNASITANTSPSVTVTVGAAVKLQVLLPGETAAPGTTTGKTGTPNIQTAGVSFNVIVNSVDAAWNVVTTATDVVKLTSTDVNAVNPANASLVSGTKTLAITLKTAGIKTVTATDVTNGAITASTSPSITVYPNTYVQLQILLPGETTAPGTATGATGTINPPSRGTSFSITVNAIDAYFNVVTTITNTVTLTSSDGTAVLPTPSALVAGTKNFIVTINSTSTSPLPTITATSGAVNKTVNVPGGTPPTAATDYFRTKSSGNWSNVSIWQSSANGSTNWQDATLTPTSAANIITIQNSHTVSVIANVTVDQVVVETGAQINVTSGITLTIASGGPGTPFDVSGIFNNAGVVTTSGALIFENGSRYQHNFSTTAGIIPTATWNNTSTCEIVGYTNFSGTMAGTNQVFGNFIWNCTGQNVAGGVILASSGTTGMHDFTVASTGTNGSLGLNNSSGTVNVYVTGDFVLSNGTITVNGSSGNTNLNIAGNFTQFAGIIQRNAGTANIVFNGNAIQNYVKSGGSIAGNVNFSINAAATVDFDNYLLDGSSGTFTLSGGASIITGNDDGFALSGPSGSIQSTGLRSFSTSANYTYNGNNAQNIGTGLPATLNNLTIDNSQGATMPLTSINYTINGSLNLTNGDLDMGTNNLISGSAFTNAGLGSLITESTSAAPLSPGKIWNISVEYSSSFGQSVVTGTYSNLSFSDAGTKTSTVGTISVTGAWNSSDGKIDLATNSTTVLFTGTSQTLDDDGTDNGTGVVFKNVSFSNTGAKTLSSGNYSIAPSGLLTMAGSAVLVTNGNLIIQSDATGSGNIGPLSGTSDISGDVNVQSFLTGGNLDINRGTRSLSTPINDAGLTVKTYQQLQNYMLITGPGSTANGFDIGGSSVPNAVTLQSYNEPPYNTGIYTPVPNIFQSAAPGKGFFLFFRGDRSDPPGKLNTPFDSPEDVTVTYTGPINKNDITISGLTNSHNALDPVNGYNLIGNPYPSAIDWETVLSNSTNMANLTVVVRAGGGAAQYLNGTSTNGGSRYIQTGQGFYAKVLDASNTGSVKFTESAKITNAPARLLSLPDNIHRLNAAAPKRELRMVLQDAQSSDETVVVFNTGYSETSSDDAPYFLGNTVSLGTLASDAKILAINFMPDLTKVAKVKLSVNSTTTNTVSLKFTDLSAIEGYDAILRDNYQNTSVAINTNSIYSFTIDRNAPLSYGTERLVLLFKIQPIILPFKLLTFDAQKTAPGSALTWQAVCEVNNDHYDVERSVDSLNFISLSTIASLRDTAKSNYAFTDKAPSMGKNYYRLKQTNTNGTFSYSSILVLTYNPPVSVQLIAYPNPTLSQINIYYKGLDERNFKLTIYNNLGFIMATSNLKAIGGIVSQNVSNLQQGVYLIEIRDTSTGTFVGRVKFIKI